MRKVPRIMIALAATCVLHFATLKMTVAESPQLSQDAVPENIKPLMRKKLDHGKRILEGLTLEQFDKIASSARSLRLLSMEAGWNVLQTEEYQQQSDDFRRGCNSLEKAAQARDVHRAALAYVSLTVRCVECHSYMRENKIKLARFDRQPHDQLQHLSP